MMGWVRVDDSFYDHDKFQHAGPLGMAQWVAGLAWSNRNLTDGFIPFSASRRLLDWNGVAWRMWSGDVVGGGEDAEADAVSDHLVDCYLWEKVPGGYRIHDYHDYQPSAEQVRAEREKNAARQAEWRARNAGSKDSSDSASNAGSNAVTNGTVTGAPNPNPNPNPITDQNPSDFGAKTKRGTRIPDPFELSAALIAWAAEKTPTVDIAAETEQFVDHHRGRGTVAKDWPATWRTWMRNAQKWSRDRSGVQNKAAQRTEANLALVRRLEAQQQREIS